MTGPMTGPMTGLLPGIRKAARRLVLLAALALTPAAALAQDSDVFSDEQVTAIEAILARHLRENPDVVLEAIEALRARMETKRKQEITRRMGAYRNQLERDPGSHVGGNPEGDVTIVEFFDYRCPYCKRDLPILRELLAEDTNLRIVYKEFPILGPDSVVASKAAIASRKQGKYHAFHVALMKSRGKLTEQTIAQIATETGLDWIRLQVDMQDSSIMAIIRDNRALAKALDITYTPGFVIGDAIIPGFAQKDALKQAIATVREDRAAQAAGSGD